MSTAGAVGSIVELNCVQLDKDNDSCGTKAGQFMVCVVAAKQSASDSDFTKGYFEVFDSEVNVKARVAKLVAASATGGGVGGRSDPSTEPGFVKKFDNVKRSDLHHFTTDWTTLCRTSHPADPLVGATFKATVPVTLPSGFMMAMCD